MKYGYVNGWHLFRVHPTRNNLVRSLGFTFHSDYRAWGTTDVVMAEPLLRYLSDEGKVKLMKHIDRGRDMVAASKSTDSERKVACPGDQKFMPFQRAGVEQMEAHGNCLLADPMGLGKTVQVVGLINDTAPAMVLIVCPASLKLNWEVELERWLVDEYMIGVAYGKSWPAAEIVIINYDILKKHRECIRANNWDMIILDECHYIKNPTAQRTKEICGGKGIGPLQGGKHIALSGTPVVNRPADLHCILKWLDADSWGSRQYYLNRYCDPKMLRIGRRSIWTYNGCTRGEELQKRLRSSVMIRRRKEDVLKDLPAKQRQIIELDVSYKGLKREVKWLKSAFGVGDSMPLNDEQYRQVVAATVGGLDGIEFGEMSTVRRENGEAKVPAVIDHLRDALDSSGKVVCFAHHRNVIDRIYEAFSEEAVKLTGDTPVAKRQQAVKDFQDNPDIRLFIGNIQAAGVGITLTSSSHVVFAESSWVSGELSQAEDRCHRIGQTNSVLVQHLVVKNSIDGNVIRTTVSKQNDIDTVLEGEA